MCSFCGELFRELEWSERSGLWVCQGCRMLERVEDEAVYCATEGGHAEIRSGRYRTVV